MAPNDSRIYKEDNVKEADFVLSSVFGFESEYAINNVLCNYHGDVIFPAGSTPCIIRTSFRKRTYLHSSLSLCLSMLSLFDLINFDGSSTAQFQPSTFEFFLVIFMLRHEYNNLFGKILINFTLPSGHRYVALQEQS